MVECIEAVVMEAASPIRSPKVSAKITTARVQMSSGVRRLDAINWRASKGNQVLTFGGMIARRSLDVDRRHQEGGGCQVSHSRVLAHRMAEMVPLMVDAEAPVANRCKRNSWTRLCVDE
jgi:hypothetical protein